MHSRRKGFVIPIILVFMLISHLVYMGIMQITQMQIKHAQLLKDYYQQSLQLLIAEQMITPHLETQEDDLSVSLFKSAESFKHQLLAGIPTGSPIFEDQQFGVYQQDNNASEIDQLYIFTVSIFSKQTYPFESSKTSLDIQIVSDSDYYTNQFQQYLLSQSRTEISDYITQLEDNDWQMTDYYEMMTPYHWNMSSPHLSHFIFSDGWVEINHQPQHIELMSHLHNQAFPIRSTIPLIGYEYRLFGQVWQYTLSIDEETVINE